MMVVAAASQSLDLLRAVAALTVFLHHARWLGLEAGLLTPFTRSLGHGAVPVFFVLSGFIISATTHPAERLSTYAGKRAARLFSVAVPALLLTLALDLLAMRLGDTGPAAYQLGKPAPYFALHLLFAGDLWSLGLTAFSDTPYWSLNYEAWYYLAFGCAAFLRGQRRITALAVVLALMGPKLLLLLPVWLAGAMARLLAARHPLPPLAARGVAAAASALLLAFLWSGASEPVAELGRNAVQPMLAFPLRFSQWFLADYVVAVLAMLLVWALCTAQFRLPAALAWSARQLAAVSFSVYLVHYPLMLFLAARLPEHRPLAAALAFGLAVAFGRVFEPQRHRLRQGLAALGSFASALSVRGLEPQPLLLRPALSRSAARSRRPERDRNQS